ncbi:MAG TPA: pyridoxal-phosphate dependent enzyme [Gemmatimonadaceae bacterium]|nr:pyridoxal-phosphate dependent enzyme [Gemmatimonadaceae bacterium]
MVAEGGRDPFTLPLLLRFPALAWVPRVRLGSFPTPVLEARLPDGRPLWIKRDDRSGAPLGGNKVRSLEFLLAGVRSGEEIVTTGARGSTHALATALYGTALGGRVTVVRWPQEMNPDAERVEAAIRRTATETRDRRTIPGALFDAAVLRLVRHARWVPPGGTSPRGALGHVNAALELAEQVAAGRLPAPARIVVPLGSGGTAAGLALGLAIAGLDSTVVGITVAPRLVANRRRVLSVASRTARFIERSAGVRVPRVNPARVVVDHEQYGGAYGRATEAGKGAARWLEITTGIPVDATYSAKALAAVLSPVPAGRPGGDGPTLFWLTFDARAVL